MITWTEEMLAALREYRAKGLPLYRCAELIGVAYPTVVYKARELGLADRMNRGKTPGNSRDDELRHQMDRWQRELKR